ncbi:hypothetical protein ACQE98_11665 [Ornithinimicrobium sp. W1679]|uniref:hypothetical protein n=1 Tax=Ornithinimicrobium sp. W1679 TaxID=3418770 RepID=UPI003CF50AAB
MRGEHEPEGGERPSSWTGLVLALGLGAATYAAWLAWDTEYYFDEAVGAFQGPYRAAQVVGCAVTFGLVTALLAMRWRPVVVAAGACIGFWAFWTVQAATQDESGLFLVGSALLLVGLGAGSAVASAIGYACRGRGAG